MILNQVNQMFKSFNSLGFNNPFFTKIEDELITKKSFNEIMDSKQSRNFVDSVSIAELFNQSHTFGDRTFIKNVSLSPWMAKPIGNKWDYVSDLPEHGQKILPDEEVSNLFYQKLKDELIENIGENKRIGILLSGGMDSRVIASLLHSLEKTHKLVITAITWGEKGSRDVNYAERISKLYNWQWKYLELNPKVLMKNIYIAADNGALYSPTHLHNMVGVSNLTDLDLIIAGSFGDSIGRAEYSGERADELNSLNKKIRNRFYLLKNIVFKESVGNIQDDLDSYYLRFPRDKQWQYFELEKQIHYMRKQLNQCMKVIDEKIPVYQAFTSPSVFGFIWSLDISCRTDIIYKLMLKNHSPELLEFPWARTGVQYLEKGLPDTLSKDYHDYGIWIRNDLYKEIKKLALSTEIKDLNIFNMKALRIVMFLNKFSKRKFNILDEYIIWIASLSLIVKKHKIQGREKGKLDCIKDTFGSLIAIVHYAAFTIRNRKKLR
ncbi:MAG: hypothetical protein ACI9OE_002137 [Mariniflexile sp.]|jgi:hypothetical protein